MSGNLRRSAEEKYPMLYNAVPDMWHKAPIARDITKLYLSDEATRELIILYNTYEQRKGELSESDSTKKHKLLELLKKAEEREAQWAAKVFNVSPISSMLAD